jgi:hypothetical protein
VQRSLQRAVPGLPLTVETRAVSVLELATERLLVARGPTTPRLQRAVLAALRTVDVPLVAARAGAHLAVAATTVVKPVGLRPRARPQAPPRGRHWTAPTRRGIKGMQSRFRR